MFVVFGRGQDEPFFHFMNEVALAEFLEEYKELDYNMIFDAHKARKLMENQTLMSFPSDTIIVLKAETMEVPVLLQEV